jgi:hypothetical protein
MKGGDMKLTGTAMKGKSHAGAIYGNKHTAVLTFPVGFAHSRTKVKGKKGK